MFFIRNHNFNIALLVGLFFVAAGCKNSDIRFDLQSAGVLAQVDQSKVSTVVFQKLWNVIRSNRLYGQFGRTPKEALFTTIDNMLLAREYKKSSHGHAKPGEDVRVEKVFLQTADFFLQREEMKKHYEQVMQEVTAPDSVTVTGLFSKGTKTDPKPKLKKEAAKQYAVLKANKYTGPASFYDFYQSLNANERISLIGKGNDEYISHLYRRFAREHYLKQYIKKDTKNKELYQEIRLIVEAGVLAGRYKNELGIAKAHVHADEPGGLEERAKAISFSRVKEYYEANIDRFAEIAGVDCRRITLDSEQKAIEVAALAEKSGAAAFKDLVLKYSANADKKNSEPGLIKGIQNGPDLHKRPRIHTLCLMTPKAGVGMFPNGSKFEVTRLEKKEMGYTPLNNDSTIVNDIRKHLAVEDVKAEFRDTKKEIYRGVTVRINPDELNRIR